jgi:hypothetical protein
MLQIIKLPTKQIIKLPTKPHLLEHGYQRPKVLEEIMEYKALGAFAEISEWQFGTENKRST